MGTITLILDNDAFRQGFLAARRWYFADIYGEDGRKAEEPQRAVQMTSDEVLRIVVTPDEQGHYHFDDMGSEYLAEYLGYLLGYVSGPLAPDEAAHYRNQQIVPDSLCSSVRA